MIPSEFSARMREMLGEEYGDFLAALEAPSVRAMRVNSLKTEAERVLSALHIPRRPVPYGRDGFYLSEEEKPGSHPLHHAGAVYLQDPGAMATVAAAPPLEGCRVLDVCASPGGKSSQLAALIGREGVLFSNEISLPRCRTLYGNLERLGVPNVTVTNTDARTLGSWFDGYFDLVLVDAPCSGEGMFRKYEVAREEWSEENVRRCAARQSEILDSVAGTVRVGGYLLYSTCTFSREENEDTVEAFLASHPEFSAVMPREEVLSHTRAGWDTPHAKGACMRRFYPHVAPGEGQFLALLRRETGEEGRGILYRDALAPIDKKDMALLRAFWEDTFEIPLPHLGRLGENVVIPPAAVPPAFVFSAGITVGTLVKGRVEPHHQLFSALGTRMKRRLDFPSDSSEIARYLRGETLSVSAPDGFAAVLADGCALGGAKVVGGTAKNRYPKGLRVN